MINTGNNNRYAGNRDGNVIDVTPANSVNESSGTINLAKVDQEREQDQSYMVTLRTKIKDEITANGRLDKLTSEISLDNNNSIIEFGKEPAMYMAKVADGVLDKYNTADVDGTATLVDALISIMHRIDIEEIKSIEEIKQERQKKTFFGKVKETAKQKLDRLVAKYQGIGNEMEKICTQLAVYEESIKKSNVDIDRMYEAAMQAYRELQEYIAAGDQALEEIKQYKDQLEANADPGDQEAMFKIREVENQINLMDKRLVDLRGAEAVALQAIPTYKIQEYTNSNLARKINSAFIVTVPAFKAALVTAVITKQQALTAQGLSALDDATSEFMKKSAANTVAQLKNSQQLVNRSVITADDIEQTWNTIMQGVQEYKAMEKQYVQIRAEEKKRIDAANATYAKALRDGTAV